MLKVDLCIKVVALIKITTVLYTYVSTMLRSMQVNVHLRGKQPVTILLPLNF